MPETPEKRFWAKVRKTDACWLWTAANVDGYGRFWINNKLVLSHRYSYALHHGEIPDGLLVLHRCDTPGCVNPDHLFLGTNADNALDRDSKERGRYLPGEQHPYSALTNGKVKEIRSRYKNGERQAGLAKEYNVTRQEIYAIVRRRAWNHI